MSNFNFASIDAGARIVDFSSTVDNCNPSNVLDASNDMIWLSEKGVPQWLCISLEDMHDNLKADSIIRTIGWRCWHPYKTNPRVVRIHVSPDRAKFKEWDTFTATNPRGLTQLFCCAPISLVLYSFIAFEILDTFGGDQTYINSIYLFSDEIAQSPLVSLGGGDTVSSTASVSVSGASSASDQGCIDSTENDIDGNSAISGVDSSLIAPHVKHDSLSASGRCHQVPPDSASMSSSAAYLADDSTSTAGGSASVDTRVLLSQLEMALGLTQDDGDCSDEERGEGQGDVIHDHNERRLHQHLGLPDDDDALRIGSCDSSSSSSRGSGSDDCSSIGYDKCNVDMSMNIHRGSDTNPIDSEATPRISTVPPQNDTTDIHAAIHTTTTTDTASAAVANGSPTGEESVHVSTRLRKLEDQIGMLVNAFQTMQHTPSTPTPPQVALPVQLAVRQEVTKSHTLALSTCTEMEIETHTRSHVGQQHYQEDKADIKLSVASDDLSSYSDDNSSGSSGYISSEALLAESKSDGQESCTLSNSIIDDDKCIGNIRSCGSGSRRGRGRGHKSDNSYDHQYKHEDKAQYKLSAMETASVNNRSPNSSYSGHGDGTSRNVGANTDDVRDVDSSAAYKDSTKYMLDNIGKIDALGSTSLCTEYCEEVTVGADGAIVAAGVRGVGGSVGGVSVRTKEENGRMRTLPTNTGVDGVRVGNHRDHKYHMSPKKSDSCSSSSSSSSSSSNSSSNISYSDSSSSGVECIPGDVSDSLSIYEQEGEEEGGDVMQEEARVNVTDTAVVTNGIGSGGSEASGSEFTTDYSMSAYEGISEGESRIQYIQPHNATTTIGTAATTTTVVMRVTELGAEDKIQSPSPSTTMVTADTQGHPATTTTTTATTSRARVCSDNNSSSSGSSPPANPRGGDDLYHRVGTIEELLHSVLKRLDHSSHALSTAATTTPATTTPATTTAATSATIASVDSGNMSHHKEGTCEMITHLIDADHDGDDNTSRHPLRNNNTGRGQSASTPVTRTSSTSPTSDVNPPPEPLPIGHDTIPITATTTTASTNAVRGHFEQLQSLRKPGLVHHPRPADSPPRCNTNNSPTGKRHQRQHTKGTNSNSNTSSSHRTTQRHTVRAALQQHTHTQSQNTSKNGASGRYDGYAHTYPVCGNSGHIDGGKMKGISSRGYVGGDVYTDTDINDSDNSSIQESCTDSDANNSNTIIQHANINRHIDRDRPAKVSYSGGIDSSMSRSRSRTTMAHARSREPCGSGGSDLILRDPIVSTRRVMHEDHGLNNTHTHSTYSTFQGNHHHSNRGRGGNSYSTISAQQGRGQGQRHSSSRRYHDISSDTVLLASRESQSMSGALNGGGSSDVEIADIVRRLHAKVLKKTLKEAELRALRDGSSLQLMRS